MSPDASQNMSASVRQRLLNISRGTGMGFQRILIRYAIERFLYRVSISTYADKLILKGAMLFTIWSDTSFRSTRDLDMLAFGEYNSEVMQSIIKTIIDQSVEDDGLIFNGESIRIDEIREQDAYNGYRIRLNAKLQRANIPVQIDMRLGDAVIPDPVIIDFLGLLDFPAARLYAYPPETVVAEKVQAIVNLGIANSRMKDYYDLFVILNQFDLTIQKLAEAMAATFERRQTEIPSQVPMGLSDEFSQDATKQIQWQQFLRNQQLDSIESDLAEVIRTLREKLRPVLELAQN